MDQVTKEDLFTRLESTIASWNIEVTNAHQGLARQIARAKEHLDSLVSILSTRRTTSPTLAAAKAKMESLKQGLVQREAAAEKAVSYFAEIEQDLADLRGDVETLRAREAKASSAERVLTAELETLRAEKGSSDAALARTRSELESLEETLVRRDAAIVAAKERASELEQAATERFAKLDALRAQQVRAASAERILSAELAAAVAERNVANEALKATSNKLESLSQLLAERDGAVDAATHQAGQLRKTVARLHAAGPGGATGRGGGHFGGVSHGPC